MPKHRALAASFLVLLLAACSDTAPDATRTSVTDAGRSVTPEVDARDESATTPQRPGENVMLWGGVRTGMSVEEVMALHPGAMPEQRRFQVPTFSRLHLISPFENQPFGASSSEVWFNFASGRLQGVTIDLTFPRYTGVEFDGFLLMQNELTLALGAPALQVDDSQAPDGRGVRRQETLWIQGDAFIRLDHIQRGDAEPKVTVLYGARAKEARAREFRIP